MFKPYNTLSRKKEIFEPIRNKKVNIFVCGPTTYDFSHLGHARTYIVYDMFVRYLKSQGYKVFYLQNITDIDDKIIQRAKEKKTSWKMLTRKFEREYFKDMKSLKVETVTKYARATEHIKEIVSQVKRLLKKGFAYQMNDGIYYDISKFKDYGKLSRRTVQQAEDATSRIDEAKEKRNKGDFCLWKLAQHRTAEGGTGAGFSKFEPAWASPFGDGRPGWHIEDTAIAEKYFGVQYDVHGGARDLIFPHHEAEIAQMEGMSGKSPMVKYWLHTGFLTVRGQKMAKSLGNFITIRDFLKKSKPEVLRFIVFSSHYRSPLDFQEKTVKEAKSNLEKLEEFLKKIREKKDYKISRPRDFVINFEIKFWQALRDDFNTPKAKGLLFDFMAKTNKKLERNQISHSQAKEIYSFFKEINSIFQILDFTKIEKKKKIPEKILELVKKREKYRQQKQWQKADEMRKEIKNLGYWVEDTDKGPLIKKLCE